jgi:hypothetical protein
LVSKSQNALSSLPSSTDRDFEVYLEMLLQMLQIPSGAIFQVSQHPSLNLLPADSDFNFDWTTNCAFGHGQI